MTNGSVTSPPPGLTSDHNIIHANGFGGVLVRFNGADYTTLAAWQAATGLDTSSAAVDPRFVNPTGTASTVDLHLQASNSAEGRGVLIDTVTHDFDGGTRSGLTPVDIGADAGNFTFDPPPAVSYPLLSSGTTANRTLTGWATIVDNGSSPVAGGASAPRLYYKKATDADAFVGNTAADNGWKYVTATNGSSPYSFTVDYSIIQGGIVTVGETIQYFVVAQDTANNLSSGPAGAAGSANPPVQNINAKPRTGINSYNIVAAINSTVTVGSGGNYTSLSGAGGLFSALNAGALTGDLTVTVTSNTTETGSVQLNATNSNSYPPFTVTIRPNSATMRTISGSAANGLIFLNGAQRVTIDGSFGGSGRYLTFRNTNSNFAACALIFINDASNNTVRNCVFEGMNSSYGVVAFRTGVLTGNDNNTVTNNQIRDRSDAAGVPGYLIGSGGTSDGIANSNNLISNNELFNFTIAGVALFAGSNSWTITGNTIYQTNARTTALTGISLNSLGANAILGNTVRDLTTTGETTGINLTSSFIYGRAVPPWRATAFGTWATDLAAPTMSAVSLPACRRSERNGAEQYDHTRILRHHVAESLRHLRRWSDRQHDQHSFQHRAPHGQRRRVPGHSGFQLWRQVHRHGEEQHLPEPAHRRQQPLRRKLFDDKHRHAGDGLQCLCRNRAGHRHEFLRLRRCHLLHRHSHQLRAMAGERPQRYALQRQHSRWQLLQCHVRGARHRRPAPRPWRQRAREQQGHAHCGSDR